MITLIIPNDTRAINQDFPLLTRNENKSKEQLKAKYKYTITASKSIKLLVCATETVSYLSFKISC